MSKRCYYVCCPLSISARQTPRFIPMLYERQSLQCKQCAMRFAGSNHGKKRLQDHLDMHFKQNSRSIAVVGRGHSRSWFVGLDVRIIPFAEIQVNSEYFRTGSMM